MSKDIKYLTLSDIHLGHKNTTTDFIIRNLDIYFDHYASTSQFTDLDFIFIAGDLFDSLLEFYSQEVHAIILWLNRLMRFCGQHSIRLRILEGTPSHDWRQSKIADTAHAMTAELSYLDFKYIDTLHIEVIKEFQFYILYVPDEYSPTTQETFHQVQELMSDLRIQQVDIAIMHGAFNYQLRNAPSSVQRHQESDYLGIVKHFINIGHIHVYNPYERIIPQGSFDRLSHGEEAPKGATVSVISENGNYHNFIENVGAKIYKTVNIKFNDLEKALNQLDNAVSKLPMDSFVRIKAKATHPIYIAFDEVKLRYPLLYLSKKKEEDEIVYDTTPLSTEDNYIPITITMDNIQSLVMQEVKTKYDLSLAQHVLLEQILRDLHV